MTSHNQFVLGYKTTKMRRMKDSSLTREYTRQKSTRTLQKRFKLLINNFSTGRGRHYPGGEIRQQSRTNKRIFDPGGDSDLPIRSGLRIFMGAIRLDNSKRNIPSRNSIGRTKHHSSSEPFLHLRNRAGVSFTSLRLEVRHLPVLRRVDHSDVDLRLHILAGNQRSSH